MRAARLKRWVLIGAVPSPALALVVPSTGGMASAQAGVTSHSSAGPSGAATGSEKVIVVLRDQNNGLSARSTSRLQAVAAEQSPVISQLRAGGASDVSTTGLLNAVIATVTPKEAAALATNTAVEEVIPDASIPGPSPLSVTPTSGPAATSSAAVAPSCGTRQDPELDPEALTNINATPAQLGSIDGSGVTVAYMADGIDPTNPDFQRNAAFASSGSPAGSAVITQHDFSGDGTNAPTEGGEAFGDASSIAAQGNQVYDLSKFVNPAHPLPTQCDIKIVGAAPGADVMALKVFAQNDDTTTSGFLQAVDYAVANGAKVLNESFGSNNFPDTTLDVIRDADDAAVAAGVTVVVSTGDGGITGTIGAPATDPNVISVGASTTFRSYTQDSFGGINAALANGKFVDNNISSVSSGGFSQSGDTVDLVAPGDNNWALCDATAKFSDCTNDAGQPTNIELFGGTSESSPLTAGAAADVIQAYATTHGGTDPSPALVKQILMSTATDIDAPAVQQGAGLINVLAAVKEAKSLPNTSATSTSGGLLIGPNQINVKQGPGATNRPGHHGHQHRFQAGYGQSHLAGADRQGRSDALGVVLHATGDADSCVSGEQRFLSYMERHRRGVSGRKLCGACHRRAVPSGLRGRLPVHGPDIDAALRHLRAGWHLRRLFVSAGFG